MWTKTRGTVDRKSRIRSRRVQARLAVHGAWRGNTAAFPQDTLCQACTTDMGSHLQAFFYKLKRKKYEPMATWSTRYRNEYTKVRRALARLQRTESPDEHPYFSPQEDDSWNWSEKNSEEVMEWDERSDADSNSWSSWNWNSWKTNRGNTWNETTTLRNEDYDEAPPLFPEPVLVCFFFSSKERTRGKREKHDIGSYRK